MFNVIKRVVEGQIDSICNMTPHPQLAGNIDSMDIDIIVIF